MTNIWLYIKLALAAALLAEAYHLGGDSARTDEEAARAAQLSAVATAYQNQVLAKEASEAQLQKVQNAYDDIKSTPDPVSSGLARRVLIRTASAGSCDVHETAGVAAGAPASAEEPGGDSGLERRLQAVLDACTADARQMNAMISLAPK